jgi:hypothetical protein
VVAVAEPPLPRTVTVNRCVPCARPENRPGELHATGVAKSSEHVVLVTFPIVCHVQVAEDDEEYRAGPDVKYTFGAVDDGGGVVVETVHEYVALALPALFATVTRNECAPTGRLEYDFGDVHATAAALSSEQVVLETVPLVDQPKDAVVAVVVDAGPLVRLTVGVDCVPDVTLHEYVALALPALFDTVTRNEWEPTARPEYDFGEVHAAAAALSTEQVVLETVPVVDQPKDAEVDVVDVAGPLVRLTVGEVTPPPPEPESTYVPNSCDQ